MTGNQVRVSEENSRILWLENWSLSMWNPPKILDYELGKQGDLFPWPLYLMSTPLTVTFHKGKMKTACRDWKYFLEFL